MLAQTLTHPDVTVKYVVDVIASTFQTTVIWVAVILAAVWFFTVYLRMLVEEEAIKEKAARQRTRPVED